MRLTKVKVSIALASLLLVSINPVLAANPNCSEVDGDYIVSFTKGVNVANEMKAAPGKPISPKFSYKSVLNGFAATLSAEQVCAFKKRPGVLIERDAEAFASGKPASSGTVNWYSWGLDRIDETTLPLSNSWVAKESTGGVGVDAYIIDTGIYSAHSQFAGRIAPGANFISDNRGTEDCNGHGTHVAGTVGGTDTGVDKQVTLIPVRVLNCRGSGSWSGIIAGLEWVRNRYLSNTTKPAVANMSLGGPKYDSVDAAVQNLISAGVIVVVAAGNDGADACNYSPARVPEAITVGATSLSSNGSSESVATYSNKGNCVRIYAPGTNIKSAWIGGATASNTISGTSMAAPHVAGIIARLLENGPKSSAEVLNALNGASTLLNKTGPLKVACLVGECSAS